MRLRFFNIALTFGLNSWAEGLWQKGWTVHRMKRLPILVWEKPFFNVKALLRLNPDNISVEDVAAVLNISNRRARRICEIAVRQGTFDRADHAYSLNREKAASFPARTL